MDETLQALKDRFPRLEWRAEADHHVGGDGRIVVTVWRDGGDSWGDGGHWRATGYDGSTSKGVRGNSAAEAVEKLTTEVQLSAALSGLPAEPEGWDVPDDPMPGPAALGCPALAAVFGLVGVGSCLLWLGVEAVRWLTGGAS